MSLATASAQEVDRGTSALDLPRKGYEPRTLRFGSTVVSPELRIQGIYDSNVFATSTRAADDFILSIAPRIDATSELGDVRLRSDAYALVAEYLDHGRESRITFGGGTKADYAISRAHNLNFGARYDREVESRADPEATTDPDLSPRKIDLLSGDIGYRYQMNRIGISLQGGVQRQNYLPSAENDRDMTTYRGSLRTSAQISAGKTLFLEGYVNRRDNRLKLDRSGIDRDATTIGVLVGTGLDIATRWSGEMAVGAFRSNPAHPGLKSFSGVGASGRLTWSPDERTALTADVFRGDVATIRSGASGRIDTKASLRLDQEVRHNLLFTARVGIRRTSYRGVASDQKLKTAFAAAEAEYLMNRFVSVFVNANYTRRSADVETEEFKRTGAGIGIRLRY